MNTNKRNKLIIGIIIVILLALVVRWYVAEKRAIYQNALIEQNANQSEQVDNLSKLIATEQADAITNRVVRDCEPQRRQQFDTLLSNLAVLNQSDLSQLRVLYGDCAGFFSDRRAILTSRLEREIEIFTNYVDLLSASGYDVTELSRRLSLYQDLAELEVERSELMSALVVTQADIIELLYAGETAQSDGVTELLKEAQNAKDTVQILTIKSNDVRDQLNAL